VVSHEFRLFANRENEKDGSKLPSVVRRIDQNEMRALS
jgi:hypothetical protein